MAGHRDKGSNWHTRFRRWHRWLALVVGLQMLLWVVSGVYMVSVPLGIVHGNHLLRVAPEPPPAPTKALLLPADLLHDYPDASQLVLTTWQQGWVYRLKTKDRWVIVDAKTGTPLSPLTSDMARKIAKQRYAGDAAINRVVALTGEAPAELNPRHLPVWQIEFDDLLNSRFYISMETGELVTKRSDIWRVFDLLWMLHIMDYENRTDFHNLLLQLAGAVGLLFSLTGVGLLYQRLRRMPSARSRRI